MIIGIVSASFTERAIQIGVVNGGSIYSNSKLFIQSALYLYTVSLALANERGMNAAFQMFFIWSILIVTEIFWFLVEIYVKSMSADENYPEKSWLEQKPGAL